MKSRKIYMLLVVLGLAMVWLGFLFVYELKIVQKTSTQTEQTAQDEPQAERPQFMAADAEQEVNEAGTGFPFILAGVGLIFVLGGASRFRHRRKKLV